MHCPYCGATVAQDARGCPSCQAALYVRCRSCGAEMEALARQCPSCGAAFAPRPAPAAPAPVALRAAGVAPARNIVLHVVLSVLTCGLWGLVMMFLFAADVNEHRGRPVLNPILDLVLVLLTCSLWGYYVMYRYAAELSEIQREEGLPESDLVLPCILLHFFALSFISMLLLQSEMNRHGDEHRARAALVA